MREHGRGWQARPRWRLTREKEIALGPGKANLLEAIGRTGSISAAGRALGMSYRRAWLLVATMNRCFARPLVITSSWRSRGASLSSDGRRALELYRMIEAQSVAATQRPIEDLKSLLRGGGSRHIRG